MGYSRIGLKQQHLITFWTEETGIYLLRCFNLGKSVFPGCIPSPHKPPFDCWVVPNPTDGGARHDLLDKNSLVFSLNHHLYVISKWETTFDTTLPSLQNIGLILLENLHRNKTIICTFEDVSKRDINASPNHWGQSLCIFGKKTL